MSSALVLTDLNSLRMTLNEAADILKCSVSTVRALIANGTLSDIRQTRIRGSRVYVCPHEVKAYASGDFRELDSLRQKRAKQSGVKFRPVVGRESCSRLANRKKL